jgi:hypothetical protein
VGRVLLSALSIPAVALAEFGRRSSPERNTGGPAVPNAARPSRVTVQPASAPGNNDAELLVRHLEWAQNRYQEMVVRRPDHAFDIAGRPVVYNARPELGWYTHRPQEASPDCVAELLQHLKVDRTTSVSTSVILVVNPDDKFPNGGGRPINGGYGTGGGVVALSTFAIGRMPNFQSTLEHELGHSFGLPHIDAHGYSMGSNPSLMSYNPAHHTNGSTPSPTPGALILEDRRGLAMNQRLFPGLQFEPRDVPGGYTRFPRVVKLKPIGLPQPAGPGAPRERGRPAACRDRVQACSPIMGPLGRSPFIAT